MTESCTILTTAANPLVAPLHGRISVTLSPNEYRTWLERNTTDPTKLEELLQPFPADLTEMWPVATMVNNVRNESADLVAPLKDGATLDLDTNPS